MLCIECFSQKKYKTNIEIFDESISAGLEKYLYSPDLNRDIQFIFVIDTTDVNHSEKSDNINRYLKGLVKRIAASEKIRISFTDDKNIIKSDSLYNLVVLNPITLKTTYNGFRKNKFLGQKTINRNIKVLISINITSTLNSVNISNFINADNNDDVDVEYIENIESSQYEFTQSTSPETGEFESVVFPALLVLASAGVTFLFFIIRSK